jgi:hypothetical protein
MTPKALKALTWILFSVGIPSWSEAEGLKDMIAGIQTEKKESSQGISAL